MVVTKTFKITGISPLLMNNPASMRPAPKGAVKKTIPTPEAEAAMKVYAEKNGQAKPHLYMPSIAFRSSLIRACIGKRIGKVGAKTLVSAGVFIVEEKCFLVQPGTKKPITEYEILTVRAVVQRQGVLRSRPKINEWETRIVFEIDDDFVTPDQVLELFCLAGKLAGAGDWRPEKQGMYGRYVVVME